MTNERAIELIKEMDIPYFPEGELECAKDMAIEALECVNSSAFKDGYLHGWRDAIDEFVKVISDTDLFSLGARITLEKMAKVLKEEKNDIH